MPMLTEIFRGKVLKLPVRQIQSLMNQGFLKYQDTLKQGHMTLADTLGFQGFHSTKKLLLNSKLI